MAKVEMKTTENEVSVSDFLKTVEDVSKRNDSLELVKIMEEITQSTAKMWGPAIIGFGKYHYKYESGREADMLRVGFSPRKDALALYIGANSQENLDIISNLGKYKTGKSCLYVKKLTDINLDVLKVITKRGFERKQFGEV
jgi:vacuolar-type H+-ATPase subunit I/STV1